MSMEEFGDPQGLPFLHRLAILGHRGLHERLERARVDRISIALRALPSKLELKRRDGVWDPGTLCNSVNGA